MEKFKKYFKTVSKFKVYIVDGDWVRDNYSADFTNFGQHYRFNFIPLNEIWLDQADCLGEDDYFIIHAMIEYGLMAQGTSYDKADDIANSIERDKRKLNKKFSDHVVHKKFICKVGKYKIYIVDGEVVRDHLNPDFTEGGNYMVYDFIPYGEIWIDNDTLPKDVIRVAKHEAVEAYLMEEKGMKYDDAHKIALKAERE
jgi:hypothetical protein